MEPRNNYQHLHWVPLATSPLMTTPLSPSLVEMARGDNTPEREVAEESPLGEGSQSQPEDVRTVQVEDSPSDSSYTGSGTSNSWVIFSLFVR